MYNVNVGYPCEAEMWNVIVQFLVLDHDFPLGKAKASADNVRANGELEKCYDIAQNWT